MDNWEHKRAKISGDTWVRPDGVAVYRPTARSRFRVHRAVAIGYGFEDLVGPKKTARTFKTLAAAQAAADREWPMSLHSDGKEGA